jgi:hypothetical protein
VGVDGRGGRNGDFVFGGPSPENQGDDDFLGHPASPRD